VIAQPARDRAMAKAYLAGALVKHIVPSPVSNQQLYRALRRRKVWVRRRDTRPEWWHDAQTLAEGGVSISHAAVYLGKSRRAVQHALREFGLR
jgi:ActR/RegA family two-component response regulator